MVNTHMSRGRLETRLLGLLLLASPASCALVLGVDDAHVDPLLTSATTTTGGTGGQMVASDGGAGQTDSGTSTGGSGSTPDAANSADSSSSGGDDAAASADGSDGVSPVCGEYCDDLMTYCTGSMQQYINLKQCLKVCALFPEGTIGDDKNSANCRLKYAAKGQYANGSELDAYCLKAGPGSDGACGTICEGYCTIMMPTCTSTRTAPYFFSTSSDCMTVCGGLKDAPPYSVGDFSLPDRNDAQCRLFHACSAVMDPDEHCEHAMGVTMCDAKPDAGG